MRVLVTGATGFVGRHLTRRLVADGHDVHVIVRPTSNMATLGEVRSEVVPHEFGSGADRMGRILEAASPDLVFHLASNFRAEHAPDDVASLVTANILFGAWLADAMSRRGPAALVNVGTSWQHRADAGYEPVCLYAATKQAFLDLLAYWQSACSLRVVTLELFDTYGPDDPRGKIVFLLVKAAVEGSGIDLSGGLQKLHLVHVADVVEGLLVAGRRLLGGASASGEVFVLDSEDPVSLRDLAKVVEAVCETPLRVNWGVRPYREREVLVPYSRGTRLPNWSPRTPLAEGLQGVFESVVRDHSV